MTWLRKYGGGVVNKDRVLTVDVYSTGALSATLTNDETVRLDYESIDHMVAES